MAAGTATPQATPIRRRIALALAYGIGAVALQGALWLDIALGVSAYLLAACVVLTSHFRLTGWRRAAVLLPVLLVCTGVVARFTSPCKLVVCHPATWEEQLAAAQHEVDAVGPGFYLTNVWASVDSYERYRTDGDLPAIYSVSFDFEHPPKPSEDGYFAYSVVVNDRDPSRFPDLISGYAYGGGPTPAERVAPIQQIRISPSEAVERVNRSLPPGQRIEKAEIHLRLPTRPGTPPVWEVRREYGESTYYISAVDGTTTAAPGP